MDSFEYYLEKDDFAKILSARRKNWSYEFINWHGSLKKAFSILIYCAQNSVKISYAGLGRLSGVPEQYTKGNSIGIVIGTMLEIIGSYCKTLPGKPKLTALCVTYTSGIPGDGYFSIFDSKYQYSSMEEKRNRLLETYKDLYNYKYWNKAELKPVKESSQLIREVFPQEDFYIPVDPASIKQDLQKENNKATVNMMAFICTLCILLSYFTFGYIDMKYFFVSLLPISSLFLFGLAVARHKLNLQKIYSKLNQNNIAEEVGELVKSTHEGKNILKIDQKMELIEQHTEQENNKRIANELDRDLFDKTSKQFKFRACLFRIGVFCGLLSIILLSIINFIDPPFCLLSEETCSWIVRESLSGAKFVWPLIQTILPLSVLVIYCGIMERRYTHLYLKYREIYMGTVILDKFMDKDYDREIKVFFAKKYFGQPFDPNKSKEKDLVDVIARLAESIRSPKDK